MKAIVRAAVLICHPNVSGNRPALEAKSKGCEVRRPPDIETPVPTTVILFKSHSSFNPYKPKYKGKTKENAGGYLMRKRFQLW
jgi:hypothetical protein